MRSPKALLAVGVICSLLASAASAPPPGAVGAPPAARSANGFVGDFDLVDQGSTHVVGHVTARIHEPTGADLVPGSVDITWTDGNPRSLAGARESHAQILEAWFWDDTYPDVGYSRNVRVIGELCDYNAPQNGACDLFAMGFFDPTDPAQPNKVGFSAPGSPWCCDGPWFDVGTGSFVLSWAGPTPGPAFLERWGTELALRGEEFHAISFNAYNLLELWLGGQAATARTEIEDLGSKGFDVLRVMASPYDAATIEAVFFDTDPDVQAAKRAQYFATFDALLDALDASGIKIVASLMWNVANLGDLGGHTVVEGMTNKDSQGHARVTDYVREVVSRYRDRATIAMWEIGNEYNLGADIQWEQFDYTSDQLAAFYLEIADLIHEIDGRHLVTTGDSSPRPAAMHLLRAVRAGEPPDWTFDSADELAEYLRLVNPDPIDVVSIHYYDDAMISLGGTLGSPANLSFFKGLTDAMDRPLFVGEIGCTAEVGCLDGSPAALPMLRETLPVLVDLRIPLTLYWYGPGVPQDAVRLVQQANRQVQ